MLHAAAVHLQNIATDLDVTVHKTGKVAVVRIFLTDDDRIDSPKRGIFFAAEPVVPGSLLVMLTSVVTLLSAMRKDHPALDLRGTVLMMLEQIEKGGL